MKIGNWSFFLVDQWLAPYAPCGANNSL